MERISAIAALGALALSAAAAAQGQAAVEARYSRYYTRCMVTGAAARGVTSGMMDCIGQEIDRQDARLNQAYKMVMQRLGTTRRETLRIAERGWIRTRDARCRRASAANEGGTLAAVTYAGCILDETIRRTMFLERYRG